MKTKTIKKVLVNKLNEWLLTIKKEELRAKVKKNILVSGGSIASMLLREDVNDYDIYIQDINVLRELAEYYCEGKVLDGRLREKYLMDEFPDIMKNKGETTYGEDYISEAFVRLDNLKEDQIKLDIPSAGVRFDNKDSKPYSIAFLSQNAISLTDDIQIVLRFSGKVEQIHKTFDFIHATNYFTFKEGLVLNQAALESLLTKELKYQGSLYPLTSIIRMKKFILRGWQMNAGEILKILFQVSELNLKDIKVLEEQLIGVDVAYFSALIDILRGTKSSEITSTSLNCSIDKVFSQYDEDIDGIKSAE